jgi:hypothetical protein
MFKKKKKVGRNPGRGKMCSISKKEEHNSTMTGGLETSANVTSEKVLGPR